MSKKIVAYSILLFSLIFSNGIVLAAEATNNATPTVQKTQSVPAKQLLYVVLAKKAEMKIATDVKNGTHHLYLKEVNPEVIYFTDRPYRISGHIAVEQFVDFWKKSNFSQVPPNAVMEAIRLIDKNNVTQKKTVSYAVELKNPILDKTNNQLSFDIVPLKGTQLPDIADSDYVALFIDDWCLDNC